VAPWKLDPATRGVGRPMAASGYSHWRAVLVGLAGCLSQHVCAKYVTETLKRSTSAPTLLEFHRFVSLCAPKPLPIGKAKQILVSSFHDYR
jgi:hypothetical protein